MSIKNAKLDFREFQDFWTEEYGFIRKNDHAICVFCLTSVVCRTSSVKRHFTTIHEKTLSDEVEEKKEAIRNALKGNESQTSMYQRVTVDKNQFTEASYDIALCIAKHGTHLLMENT